MKVYSVRVTTSRNTFFEWEIEDSTAHNALVRITKKIKGLDVIKVEIVKDENE